MGRVARIDRWQRDHHWVGFPLAMLYKVFDDRGLYLASLITYYGFVSLFPLLLLFLSTTGFLLDGRPRLRTELVHATLERFPAIGPALSHSITGFHGSGGALAVGVLGTLYGGLGAMQAAQAAFNKIYGIPRNEQPNPCTSRLRSLVLVALLGIAILACAAITTLTSTSNALSQEPGAGTPILSDLLAFVIDCGWLTAAFQVLTACELRASDVLTGGVAGGVAWESLQVFGAHYVAHQVSHGTLWYNVFGIVLVSIAWIYLQTLALMVAAEVNAVLHYRLWPRALLAPFTDHVELTDADRRAYTRYARGQRFKGFATVRVDFGPNSNSHRQGH